MSSSKFKLRPDIMNILCRICGQEDRNCVHIFGETGKKQGIERKIRKCLPLVVLEADPALPKQICISCLHKLDATWELFTLCKEGQYLIAQKLRSINNSALNGDKQTVGAETIKQKLQTLSENQMVTIGSAVIMLAPASPPRTPAAVKDTTAAATPVVVPAADTVMAVSAQSVTMTAQSMTTPVQSQAAQNMIVAPAPMTFIQTPTTPVAKPVVFQQRNERRQLSTARKSITPQVARRSIPAPKPLMTPRRNVPLTSRQTLREGDSASVPPRKRAPQLCKYCNKTFPDDIIDHHVSLHLRQSFFTCIDCNKNFRSEQAMSRHRCGANDPINLDPDDEPICL